MRLIYLFIKTYNLYVFILCRLLPQECFNNYGEKNNRQQDTDLVYLHTELSDVVRVSAVNQVES